MSNIFPIMIGSGRQSFGELQAWFTEDTSEIQVGDFLMLTQIRREHDSIPALQVGFTSLATERSDGLFNENAVRLSWKIAEAIDVGASYSRFKHVMIMRATLGYDLAAVEVTGTVSAGTFPSALGFAFAGKNSGTPTINSAPADEQRAPTVSGMDTTLSQTRTGAWSGDYSHTTTTISTGDGGTMMAVYRA